MEGEMTLSAALDGVGVSQSVMNSRGTQSASSDQTWRAPSFHEV